MDGEKQIVIRPNGEGMYKCQNCDKVCRLFDSLKRHYKRHHSDVKIKKRANLTEAQKAERKRTQYEKQKTLRRRQATKRKASEALQLLNRPYTCDDALTYGKMTNSNVEFKLVECKDSLIDGAGIGVFACVDLMVNDIVTFYSGEFVQKQPEKPELVEYSIEVAGGFLLGLQTPAEGQGLGSFLNRESRRDKKWKNCEMILNEDTNTVFVRVTKTIRAGQELYTCYGYGYRMKKLL